jgi:recombinational DNA repair protein RecR
MNVIAFAAQLGAAKTKAEKDAAVRKFAAPKPARAKCPHCGAFSKPDHCKACGMDIEKPGDDYDRTR